MLRLEHAYWAVAAFLLVVGASSLARGRRAAAGFWSLLGALVGGGEWITTRAAAGEHWPGQLAGVGVVALALMAPSLRAETDASASEDAQARERSAARLGHRLFGPALLIPVLTVAIALGGERIAVGTWRLFEGTSMTLLGVACGSLLALVAALRVTRSAPRAAVDDGRRLLDTIGWAAILPMLLATLGAVLTATGVGDAIAHLTSAVLPTDERALCVLAYGVGMAALTMMLGNAFAAFPVMTAGIGLPLLIVRHHGDPAIVGALGMLSGYCGTLLTPMAANFNVVPAVLLELDDANGVIRAQVPTALALLVVNLVLMNLLAFP